MSGSLLHSPADIVRQLLVNLALGTAPTAAGAWPVYIAQEPDTPDSCLTVYDTTSRMNGRTQTDGRQQEHFGFQVRIRDANHADGYAKARAIAVALDETAYWNSVTVGASTYLVQSVSRTSGVLMLGKESPTSKRSLFTINAVAAIRQTS